MQRALVLVVAFGVAAWVRAIAAQSLSPSRDGEQWLAQEDGAPLRRLDGARIPTESATDAARTAGVTGTAWVTEGDVPRRGATVEEVDLGYRAAVRFGSGLEDDAPARAPSVFMQSGLEPSKHRAATLSRSGATRFGSGLEEDAPVRTRNVFLLSGLEADAAPRRLPARSAVVRFGSGLEEDAHVRATSVFYEAGF